MVLATQPPSTPPQQRDPFERDRARFARYQDRRAFYEGRQWLGRPRHPRETRLVVNYARALVRKAVSYALPEPVGFAVPPPVLAADRRPEGTRPADDAPEGDPPEAPDLTRARQDAGEAQANRVETLLAELLSELDADRLDFALAIDSAVLGDGVIKVTWDTDASRPRLAAVDPATLMAWWSPDTPTEAYKFAQHYALPGQALTALGWARPGALQPEQLFPVREEWTADRWVVTVAGQTARDEKNPYGWLPYLVLPNNPSGSEFWGESALDDLIDVCREFNTRLSTLSRILELSGSPIAVLENVDGSDGITVGPGAKWELPEGAKAYLLDLLASGGVQLHIEFIEQLRTALHDLAETPRTAFGEAGRAIAGAALEVELQPLVQRVKRMRRGMTSLYRRRNAMLLDLMERFGAAPIGGLRRTEPVWPPILPSDREADARVGVQLVNAKVRSRRSVASDLGEEDPDAEIARIVEEARRLAAMVETDDDTGRRPEAGAEPEEGEGDPAGAGTSADAGNGEEEATRSEDAEEPEDAEDAEGKERRHA